MYSGYMGIMEQTMETTIVYWGGGGVYYNHEYLLVVNPSYDKSPPLNAK